MTSFLSSSEIQTRWVLIGDPETDQATQQVSGRVLFHSKDRDEVYRKPIDSGPKRIAVLYMGSPSPDSIIIL